MVTYACMPCIFMGWSGTRFICVGDLGKHPPGGDPPSQKTGLRLGKIHRGEIRQRRKRDSKVLDAISWHSGMMSALGH